MMKPEHAARPEQAARPGGRKVYVLRVTLDDGRRFEVHPSGSLRAATVYHRAGKGDSPWKGTLRKVVDQALKAKVLRALDNGTGAGALERLGNGA